MTKIEVQCLLIDREHKPAFGDVFSVEVHSNATIEKLRDAIKESTVRRPTIQHMDIDAVMLTVWRCSDPKLLSTMNRTRLGKKLHDIDLTDETKVKELAAGAAIKDLHLSDGELLLVQLPESPTQVSLTGLLTDGRLANLIETLRASGVDIATLGVASQGDYVDTTAHHESGPYDTAVTIIAYRPSDTRLLQWQTALVWSDIYQDFVFQPRIKAVVETPRRATREGAEGESARHLFSCLSKAIEFHTDGSSGSNLLRRILSDESNVPDYMKWHPELFHFVHATDYAAYQSTSLADGAIVDDARLTLYEAYSVVLEKFSAYWLRKINGAQCTSGKSLPFPLIVDERDESGHTTKHRRYRPVPDVAFLSYNFPLFLVEFDNQQDKYRLLVQMACALRLALAFLKESGDNDPSFFLMGAFFTKDHKIFRYFFFVDENQKTRYHERIYQMREIRDLVTFLFEFYNYVRHVGDANKLGNKETKIKSLTDRIKAVYTESLGTPGKQGRKRPRSGLGQDGANPSPGHGSTHAQLSAMIDALQKARYQVQVFAEEMQDAEEYEPLVKVPSHLAEARAPNGQAVIAKLVSKNELSFLWELSREKSRQNHVIPLLDAVQSILGPLAILPLAHSLSYEVLRIVSKDLDFVQLSRQLVEGVAFLHRKKIAHNDIKLENLVYDFRIRRLYIIDLGLALRCENADETFEMSCGTPGWTAPEIVLDDGLPHHAFSPIWADLWACGNVLRVFAEVAEKEDSDMASLRALLMNRDPRRRPLLHELIGEELDFWTSGRLSEALNSLSNGRKVHPMWTDGACGLKRARDDYSITGEEKGASKILKEDTRAPSGQESLS